MHWSREGAELCPDIWMLRIISAQELQPDDGKQTLVVSARLQT